MESIIIMDTSVVVEILRGTELGKRIVSEISTKEVGISSLTVYELVWSRPEEERKVLEMVQRLRVFNFELRHALKAAEIRRTLGKKGITIDEVDIFIASIALEQGCDLVSCDRDFEKIPGLQASIF